MARRISRKSMKHDEFVETAFDVGAWVEDNWQKVAGVIAAVAIVVLAIAGWRAWTNHRAKAAETAFGEALELYESVESEGLGTERLQEAEAKFGEVARKAGSGPLGQMANFYRGVVQLELENPQGAVEALEGVLAESPSPVLEATVRASLATAYERAGETEKAVAVWREFAGTEEGMYPPDLALHNLGLLLERAGRNEEARGARRELAERFPQSPY